LVSPQSVKSFRNMHSNVTIFFYSLVPCLDSRILEATLSYLRNAFLMSFLMR